MKMNWWYVIYYAPEGVVCHLLRAGGSTRLPPKVLANRLKQILPMIISKQQSAFVPGKLITDNSLIAFECLHTIRQQDCKRPFFALKIDMMKTYDRVEWDYLHGCLSKLGFAPSWIQSVMRCAMPFGLMVS
jgi:hypothetical protein